MAAQLGVATTEAAINAALRERGYAGWIMRSSSQVGAVTIVDPGAVRFVRDLPVDANGKLVRMASRVAARWLWARG